MLNHVGSDVIHPSREPVLGLVNQCSDKAFRASESTLDLTYRLSLADANSTMTD